MFQKSIYKDRRSVLKSNVGSGLIILLGNEESPMNFKDNTYHFRQDSTFLYYFGINDPNLVGIIDVDANNEFIVGDELSIDAIVWMGRQTTLKEKSAAAAIDVVLPSIDLSSIISKALDAKRKIHFLPPYRGENKIKLSGLLGKSIIEVENGASVDLIKAVVKQRSHKAPEEVAELDKAVTLSAEMHKMVMQFAKPGMSENAIAAAIQEYALNHANGLSYPAILTVNGHILHNHYHGNTLKSGQMVLNDSGVETKMGYAGDLTRTFPVDKKFTSLQREMYEIILNAHKHAISLLSPAVRYLDIHFESCKMLATGLKEFGLMKGNVDDAVAAGAHALFFQCGTGHMMGLDVHDMEDLGEQYVGYTETLKKNTDTFGLKSLRLGKQLEPGFVLTVEPGLYFIPELIEMWSAKGMFKEFINYDKVEKLRDFSGIRIEDNFLITENGYQLLGEPLEIEIEDVEAIRATAY